MSAAAAKNSANYGGNDGYDDGETRSFAVVAAYNQDHWIVRRFPDDFNSLQTAERAVRTLRAEGAALAMLCVEEAYFVLLRPTPGGNKLLLSDLTMAVDDDYAAEIAEELGVDVPDLSPEEIDEEECWPEGDFDILSDLGVSEEVLGVICDDDQLWPSEQLGRIAQELGCDEEFCDVTGVVLDADEEW